MSEIPKIVRQRLHQPDSASPTHPDANVLTAFAEQSLTGLERTAVLDHLSYCAECREILALALPASESLQPALQFSPGPKRTWSILRWGLSSAGVLALLVFGFIEYGHRAELVRMAKNAPPAAAMQRDEFAPASPAQNQFKAKEAAQASAADTGSAGAIPQKDQQEPASPPKADLSRNFRSGTLAHGPRQTNQWQQQNANAFRIPARVQNVPEAKQPIPPPNATSMSGKSEMVEVQSAPGQMHVQSQVLDSVVAANRPTSQPLPSSPSDAEVSRAKSAPAPVPSQAGASTLESQGRTFQALQLITPTWTVNSGRLQRSLDQGQTWQDVNVTASPDNAASMQLAVASRKVAKESAKKDAKVLSPAPMFRAVAANGPDVWAGGATAALYHSSDAGAHWAQVIPSSESAILSGDVLTLEFPDAQNGRISTSTGEVWTTADNGQSWKKQ